MAYDKWLHLSAGFIIGAVLGGYTGKPIVAILAALAAGIAKEGYDAMMNARAKKAGLPPPHSVEFADAAYTVAGGVLVAIGMTVLTSLKISF